MSNPLSKYFISIGAKRLSDVEVEPVKSNQHEFNGVKAFKEFLGSEKVRFQGRFIYLSDNEENIIENAGLLTWYDARENHATRTEYRLYYTTNDVIQSAARGDLVIIGQTVNNELIVIVAQKNSTSETQLLWLFGLQEVENKFIVKDLSSEKTSLGFAGKYIISTLGIEIEETAPNYIDELIRVFGKKFPSTKEFSDYARSTVKDISSIESPDETLIAWLEREELLFRTLENIIVKERLSQGFGKDGTDVDEFINFSLSVQNRRKSRAGHSFENHLSVIFRQNNVKCEKGAITERNNKPDFLFPGYKSYHDPIFDVNLLTMLGVKTTAKDRWRQILSEAAKIPNKHLITLEPSISKNQTDDMIANKLQLVIPKSIFPTYTKEQQSDLLTLSDFIIYVKRKQIN